MTAYATSSLKIYFLNTLLKHTICKIDIQISSIAFVVCTATRQKTMIMTLRTASAPRSLKHIAYFGVTAHAPSRFPESGTATASAQSVLDLLSQMCHADQLHAFNKWRYTSSTLHVCSSGAQWPLRKYSYIHLWNHLSPILIHINLRIHTRTCRNQIEKRSNCEYNKSIIRLPCICL